MTFRVNFKFTILAVKNTIYRHEAIIPAPAELFVFDALYSLPVIQLQHQHLMNLRQRLYIIQRHILSFFILHINIFLFSTLQVRIANENVACFSLNVVAANHDIIYCF